ncbi:MAG: ASPIC/UnbV domain-containing protein, partial [Planctomycetaceae bacterium]|nr:ASPIC/UnbV domain-containing protein [Planctomycetaceae bacterium]
QLKSGSSYASSSEPRLCFGLGTAGSVAEVEIRWPGGTIQRTGPVKADQLLVVRQEHRRR